MCRIVLPRRESKHIKNGNAAAASHRRRPAAVYLGFLQSSTAETVVFLGRFLDIFVMVRKDLRVHALMNVFLRNESDE